jgi:hypothetical protein
MRVPLMGVRPRLPSRYRQPRDSRHSRKDKSPAHIDRSRINLLPSIPFQAIGIACNSGSLVWDSMTPDGRFEANASRTQR